MTTHDARHVPNAYTPPSAPGSGAVLPASTAHAIRAAVAAKQLVVCRFPSDAGTGAVTLIADGLAVAVPFEDAA